jgi:hypothetical protein
MTRPSAALFDDSQGDANASRVEAASDPSTNARVDLSLSKVEPRSGEQ